MRRAGSDSGLRHLPAPTQTRSAWAGAIVATAVFLGLWLFRSGYCLRHLRTFYLAALLLVGALVLLWFTASPAGLRDPVTTRIQTLSHLAVDASWQGRLAAWRKAAPLVKTAPILGIGFGPLSGNAVGLDQNWRPVGAIRAPFPFGRSALLLPSNGGGDRPCWPGIVCPGTRCIRLAGTARAAASTVGTIGEAGMP